MPTPNTSNPVDRSIASEPKTGNGRSSQADKKISQTSQNLGKSKQGQIQFSLNAPEAQNVTVAGTFNHWHPMKTPLTKNGSSWKATVSLPTGRHEYRFVVDGAWISDPNASESTMNPYGETNSVILV